MTYEDEETHLLPLPSLPPPSLLTPFLFLLLLLLLLLLQPTYRRDGLRVMVTYPATMDVNSNDRRQYLPAQRVAEVFRNMRKEDIEVLGKKAGEEDYYYYYYYYYFDLYDNWHLS